MRCIAASRADRTVECDRAVASAGRGGNPTFPARVASVVARESTLSRSGLVGDRERPRVGNRFERGEEDPSGGAAIRQRTHPGSETEQRVRAPNPSGLAVGFDREGQRRAASLASPKARLENDPRSVARGR
ncbi:hypothetical protein [Natronococcus jeotgali]|uniref:Uncharacterized protein n=1 Tax=Natronococcus jeotgali DSM 18795 TaxID=1227498 RepID=L9WR80_9EURY|nr:hypothetical protein [Natronococcus jeotgali]ELY50828.1 hypothetical protein C492_21662 [Natronococcus jeotgali DSM 18795]